MVRAVAFDDRIEKEVQQLLSGFTWSIGCIVGELTDHKDQVVCLPRTPVELNSGEAGDAPGPQSLVTIGDDLLARHALQVQGMLPGGLDVIGLYVVAPSGMLSSAVSRLPQFICSVEKAIRSDFRVMSTTERLLIKIDSGSNKVTCQSVDTADEKAMPRPADWKHQKNMMDRWLTLATTVTIDTMLNVPIAMQSKSLKKQIQNGLRPVCDNLWNSLGIINGSMYDAEEALCPSQHGKQRRNEEENLDFIVDLFGQPSQGVKRDASRDAEEDSQCTECCAKMYFRGTMVCRAFVNGRATAKEGILALKTDVMRSLLRRCELLCEDLLQTEEEQDTKVLYETPRRVYVPLPDTRVQLTDYIFPDEMPADVSQRIKELLNISVPEAAIELEAEKLPDDTDLIKPQISFTNLDDSDESPRLYRPLCSFSTALTLISIGVGGVAMGISYILLRYTE